MISLIAVAPMITQTPSSVIVEEGQNVSLHCKSSGQPTPKVTWRKAFSHVPEERTAVVDGKLAIFSVKNADGNLVPRGCIPFGQHQGCKTSGIINVKMLANRNLIGYYFLPEVYEKEVSKQEIKVLRMLLLDVFDHVRDGQWERNLKMGDAN